MEKLLFKHNNGLKNEGGGRVGNILYFLECLFFCLLNCLGPDKGQSTLTISNVATVTVCVCIEVGVFK